MFATAQTDLEWGGTAILVRRAPLSARFGPDPLGGYRYPGQSGRRTGESPCDLPLVFPPTDRNGPDRLFRRAFADLKASDLNAKHVDWNSGVSTRRAKLLRDYADAKSCLIFGPEVPNHQPIKTPPPPRCLRHRDNKETFYLGLSDIVLCPKLGSPTCTHRNYVSIILSPPTGSP
jgi:hypothetical protein